MPASLRLSEIVNAMESHTQDTEVYLDRESGKILFVTEDDQAELEGEDIDNAPDWQREHLREIQEAFAANRVIALPDAFDIHDWAIMDKFCGTISNPTVRDELIDAIHGTGAFRMFRATLDRHGLRERWYSFRDGVLEEIAQQWCQDNNITYE